MKTQKLKRLFVPLVLLALAMLNAQLFAAFAQSGTWTTNTAPMLQPNAFPSAAALNGRIYVAGGYPSISVCGGGGGGIHNLLSYDPSTDKWNTNAPMHTARFRLMLVAFNGKLYAIGGQTGCGAHVTSSSVEAYDPTSDVWTTKINFPVPIQNGGAVVAGGKLYVMGGWNSNNGNILLASIYAYDPTNDVWTSRTAMPEPRMSFTCAAVDNRIYVMGGNYSNGSWAFSTWVYDTLADAWTTNSSASIAQSLACAGTINNGGLILVCGGGYPGVSPSSLVQVYNHLLDSWSPGPALPIAEVEGAAATLNQKVYVIGGQAQGGTAISTVQVFTPSLFVTNVVVAPANPVIGVGSNLQFTATGYVGDGSSQTLTNQLNWTSSNPAVASIDPTNGLAIGLSIGTTVISENTAGVIGNTLLTVVTPPTITTNPASVTSALGGSITLSVAANGGNLSYQWQCNGTNIDGATGATLTITNVSAANIGVYTVIVNNAAGSVSSSSVTLASVDIKMFAGIIVNGPLGSNYLIQATSNLSSNNWTALTNVALPAQPYIYIDYSSPTNRQQFYRAVPQ